MYMEKEYPIRNDLAILNHDLKRKRVINFEQIKVISYQKERYHYTNILFQNLNIKENKLKIEEIIIRELKKYFRKYHLTKKDIALVVGLGNSMIASDSIGVKTVELVKSTAYLSNIIKNEKIRPVYTYLAGIMKDRGFMPYEGILALKKQLKPDFLIVVDAFVSSDIQYLNRLIQITDQGIVPGSGIWNLEEEISYRTLKIPVIVIGIPTVVEASTIIRDALGGKENTISFHEGYDFLVSPKDIDIMVLEFSQILASSINKVLNSNNVEW